VEDVFAIATSVPSPFKAMEVTDLSANKGLPGGAPSLSADGGIR
jgi:hypothetical protein